MKKYTSALLLTAITGLTLLTSACDKAVDSPRGFSLPEGNAANGEQVFIKYQCLSCHTLEGMEAPNIEDEIEVKVRLGGESMKVTTYAELVTSVINPSHKIAAFYRRSAIDEMGMSKMRNYNDVMTVTELVDLVSYLQGQYKIKPYQYTSYGRYY